MSASFFFLEDPSLTPGSVLNWFRSQEERPEETETEYGAVLYFRQFGPLEKMENGEADPDRSPVVVLKTPQVRRGVLWTVGEVQLLPVNIRSQFPKLDSIQRTFAKWLRSQPLVFENRKGADNPFEYYLEGGAKNWGERIYALPTGMKALQAGRYFVSARDNDSVLNRVCGSLKLRGVNCSD